MLVLALPATLQASDATEPNDNSTTKSAVTADAEGSTQEPDPYVSPLLSIPKDAPFEDRVAAYQQEVKALSLLSLAYARENGWTTEEDLAMAQWQFRREYKERVEALETFAEQIEADKNRLAGRPLPPRVQQALRNFEEQSQQLVEDQERWRQAMMEAETPEERRRLQEERDKRARERQRRLQEMRTEHRAQH